MRGVANSAGLREKGNIYSASVGKPETKQCFWTAWTCRSRPLCFPQTHAESPASSDEIILLCTYRALLLFIIYHLFQHVYVYNIYWVVSCLVCIVVVVLCVLSQLSCVYCRQLYCVYCCSCLVCIVSVVLFLELQVVMFMLIVYPDIWM